MLAMCCTVITLYSNMDQEGVIYGIISTSVTVMITSYDFLPKCDVSCSLECCFNVTDFALFALSCQ